MFSRQPREQNPSHQGLTPKFFGSGSSCGSSAPHQQQLSSSQTSSGGSSFLRIIFLSPIPTTCSTSKALPCAWSYAVFCEPESGPMVDGVLWRALVLQLVLHHSPILARTPRTIASSSSAPASVSAIFCASTWPRAREIVSSFSSCRSAICSSTVPSQMG